MSDRVLLADGVEGIDKESRGVDGSDRKLLCKSGLAHGDCSIGVEEGVGEREAGGGI